MGQILVRNLDDLVIQRLKDKAKRDGTSLEQTAREALAAVTRRTRPREPHRVCSGDAGENRHTQARARYGGRHPLRPRQRSRPRVAVVDASVAVRWFIYGVGNERAAPWLERTDLIAPDFILAEVGNAFWRYIQRGHLELEEATEILKRLPGSFFSARADRRTCRRCVASWPRSTIIPSTIAATSLSPCAKGRALSPLIADLAKIAGKAGVERWNSFCSRG